MLLPTMDTISDVSLCVALATAGHSLWSLAVGLPILVTWLFTLAAYHRCPKTFHSERWWWVELVALLIQVISPYSSKLLLPQLDVASMPGVAPVLCGEHLVGPGVQDPWVEGEEAVLLEVHLHPRALPGEPASAGHPVLHLDILHQEDDIHPLHCSQSPHQ